LIGNIFEAMPTGRKSLMVWRNSQRPNFASSEYSVTKAELLVDPNCSSKPTTALVAFFKSRCNVPSSQICSATPSLLLRSITTFPERGKVEPKCSSYDLFTLSRYSAFVAP